MNSCQKALEEFSLLIAAKPSLLLLLLKDQADIAVSTRTSSGFFLLLADSIFENFLLALLAESSSYKYKSL